MIIRGLYISVRLLPYMLIPILLMTDSVSGYINYGNSSSNSSDSFRADPVIKIRPLNDIINISTEGIIELYMDNPGVNDAVLNVDIRMNVPSGVHILGEGFGEFSGAGTVYGKFNISPGSAKTIYINVRPEKTGKFFVQLDAIYWPGNNKESYQQIILTHDFRSVETDYPTIPTPLPTPTPITAKEFLQILDHIVDYFERIIRIIENVKRSTEY